MFSVRIVNVDYYLAKPLQDLDPIYNSFRGLEITSVPVVRVFGTTTSGQKVCLHIHGVFPYFYIPFEPGSLKDPLSVANSIDSTLNSSIGKSSKLGHHVHSVTHVSGIPMYGYHETELQFLKVFFYNPHMAKKAGEMLLSCSVTGTMVQPHEAHVPYILQFFMDYNLQGMNLIHLAHVRFRRKGEKQFGTCQGRSSSLGISSHVVESILEDNDELLLQIDSNTIWTEKNIPDSLWLEDVNAISSCEIEVDAVASDILNQLQLTDGVQMNPGLAVLWEEEKSRRDNLGIEEDVELPSSPVRPVGNKFKSKSDADYLSRLKEKLKIATPSELVSRPVRSITGHEVTFAIEAVDSVLTPATLVDIHVEGELSKSLGLAGRTQSSQTQQESIVNKTQDIVLDQSDMDLVNLLENLQGEVENKAENMPESPKKAIDQDSILGFQFSGKGNSGEDSSSSEDEVAMTQTHWADDSFSVSQIECIDEICRGNVSKTPCVTQESRQEHHELQATPSESVHSYAANAAGSDVIFPPINKEVQEDSELSDDIIDRSDESGDEIERRLIGLDGVWDSDADDACIPEVQTSRHKICPHCGKSHSRNTITEILSLDGQFDSSGSEDGKPFSSAVKRKRRRNKTIESRLSRSNTMNGKTESSENLSESDYRQSSHMSERSEKIENSRGLRNNVNDTSPEISPLKPLISPAVRLEMRTLSSTLQCVTRERSTSPEMSPMKALSNKQTDMKETRYSLRNLRSRKCLEPSMAQQVVQTRSRRSEERKQKKSIKQGKQHMNNECKIQKCSVLLLDLSTELSNYNMLESKSVFFNMKKRKCKAVEAVMDDPVGGIQHTGALCVVDTKPIGKSTKDVAVEKHSKKIVKKSVDNEENEREGATEAMLNDDTGKAASIITLDRERRPSSPDLFVPKVKTAQVIRREEKSDLATTEDVAIPTALNISPFDNNNSPNRTLSPSQIPCSQKSNNNSGSERLTPILEHAILADDLCQIMCSQTSNQLSSSGKTTQVGKDVEFLSIDSTPETLVGESPVKSEEGSDQESRGENFSLIPRSGFVEKLKCIRGNSSQEGGFLRISQVSSGELPEFPCGQRMRSASDATVTSRSDEVSQSLLPPAFFDDMFHSDLPSSQSPCGPVINPNQKIPLCNSAQSYVSIPSSSHAAEDELQCLLRLSGEMTADLPVSQTSAEGQSCASSGKTETGVVVGDLDSAPVAEANTDQITNDVSTMDEVYRFVFSRPPSFDEVKESLKDFELQEVSHDRPFWGDPTDSKTENVREIGGIVLAIESNSLANLQEFESCFAALSRGQEDYFSNCDSSIERDFVKSSVAVSQRVVITLDRNPPSFDDVKNWLENMKKGEINQIDRKLSPLSDSAPNQGLKPQCERPSEDVVSILPSRESLEPQTPHVPFIIKENETPILIGREEKNDGQSPVLSSQNKASGPDRSPQIIESTPQTSRKRRVSWDSNIGNKLSWKKKRLSLSKKSGKRSLDITISPIFSRVASPSGSPDSVVTSPILKHVLRKQHRSGRFSQSQILDPALKNSFGFKVKFQNLQNTKSGREYSYLTTMVMEVFVLTRGDLRPDPEYDEVCCLFYSILNDVPQISKKPLRTSGCIVNRNACGGVNKVLHSLGIEERSVHANYAQDEVELFGKFVEVVSFWDPDIVVGYEIEMLSWGYVLQRGKKLELPLHIQLSRLPNIRDKKGPEPNASKDKNGERNSDPDWESYAGLQIPGRIVLNLWRLMKDEIPVQSYTYENMAFHILHQRVPAFSHRQLTEWWMSESSRFRYYVFEYFLRRVKGCIDLIEQLNLIGRTSELARLFGIQFFEVFSRGSQWRVESLMLRLAKAANMVSVSPSFEQRARMKAPEWLPLILEPQSRFYVDPVLVLDFQSLYPSVMIAYNYCFSTCLGRLQNLGDPGYVEFGCTYLRVKPEMLKELLEEDMITFSPAGIAFVRREVREGILPRMLRDILDTRLMVKQSMKIHKNDAILQRVLDSRQLGLKLIANVTYGYTSANFSGRMPAVEVGDSVVAKGRETLERAISLVENTTKWGAKVIYGDTDSLFVQLPGKTREDAFRIGEEIAEAVTLENPKPVKLKFEKVYHPCILQTKKRYVGYKYEKADQKEPVYEAKGIETVRRDGCPATVKILEKSLRILFETKDISLVKSYVQRQFTKILSGSAHLQDFIFAKEFRGRAGYRPGAAVPAMEIAKKQTSIDPRAEPRSGERVPYVIVYGSPGLPLIRLVKTPQEVLADPSLRLNANYYISKVIIPPLNRCLSLLGADTASWYESMQRPASSLTNHLLTTNNRNLKGLENRIGESSIASFFRSLHCVICDSVSSTAICSDCQSQPDVTITAITSRIRSLEAKYAGLVRVCGACAGDPEVGRRCVSLDCPVMYKRKTAEYGFNDAKALFEVLERFSSEVS